MLALSLKKRIEVTTPSRSARNFTPTSTGFVSWSATEPGTAHAEDRLRYGGVGPRDDEGSHSREQRQDRPP